MSDDTTRSTRPDAENTDTTYAYHLHPTAPRWNPFPPRDRHDFGIAIICALPLEASAIVSCFDEQYDDHVYGKASGDSNAYSIGMIGRHYVVLTHIPNGGKVAAATAAAYLRASFQGIQLALVVGICGATPIGKQEGRNIFLGDVIISEGLVQHDLGRKFPNNRFLRKDTTRENLPRPGPEIRAALAKLKTDQGRSCISITTHWNVRYVPTTMREIMYAIWPLRRVAENSNATTGSSYFGPG